MGDARVRSRTVLAEERKSHTDKTPSRSKSGIQTQIEEARKRESARHSGSSRDSKLFNDILSSAESGKSRTETGAGIGSTSSAADRL